jgi:hypothetical protein
MNICFCNSCMLTALFELGLCALTPQQFIQRARRYKLSEEQQKVVDTLRMQVWNEWAKGERVG